MKWFSTFIVQFRPQFLFIFVVWGLEICKTWMTYTLFCPWIQQTCSWQISRILYWICGHQGLAIKIWSTSLHIHWMFVKVSQWIGHKWVFYLPELRLWTSVLVLVSAITALLLINIITTKMHDFAWFSYVCRHDNWCIKRLRSAKTTYVQGPDFWAAPLHLELNVHVQSMIK